MGAGQCGMKLSQQYHQQLNNGDIGFIALSTSSEDSVNIDDHNIVQVSTEGS